MKSPFPLISLVAVFMPALHAEDTEGWVSLFNGKDLGDWVNVNCAPETWSVSNGVIKCTGTPTGALRRPMQYENFIFEVDWRHMKEGGNAGIFVWGSPVAAPGVPFLRAIEVQVLDNGYGAKGKGEWFTTHGDIFPIHGSAMKPIFKGNGSRCFPIEERSKSAPEWNHYRIEANDGKIRLSVNGKEVSGGDNCVWRKGYLGLESEGSPTEWKNLRLKELPSTGATAADSAPLDTGWKSLFNGVDLRGWTSNKDTGFKGGDWSLTRPEASNSEDKVSVELPFNLFELTIDWKGVPGKVAQPKLTLKDAKGGSTSIDLVATLLEGQKPEGWHRFTLNRLAHLSTLLQKGNLDAKEKWSLEFSADTAPVEVANIYIREKKPE